MRNKVITYDVFRKSYRVNPADLKFSFHIYGLIVDRNKILISPQWDGYDFPGGTAIKGETHIETLKREFKEETGYDIEPIKLLDIYTSFFRHPKKNINYQSYLVFYQVKIIGGELSDFGFDIDEREYAKIARWVNVDSLKHMRHVCSIDIDIDSLLMKMDQMGD